jgi:hypothetical protein
METKQNTGAVLKAGTHGRERESEREREIERDECEQSWSGRKDFI